MSNLLKITILKTCETKPPHPEMGPKTGYTRVQWHCGDGQSYTLHLPGGIFRDHPDDFTLQVNSSDFVPEPPLELALPIVHWVIINYIFDDSGNNCKHKKREAPPDIIINP